MRSPPESSPPRKPATEIDMTSKLPVIDRRRWLQVSSLGWRTPALPPLFAGRASRADESPAKVRLSPIKSVIVVFHYGGPSHFETYDPKPHAPVGIRSEYGTIPTAVPGT